MARYLTAWLLVVLSGILGFGGGAWAQDQERLELMAKRPEGNAE